MAAIFDGTNGLTFNDGTLMGTANSLGMRNALFNADFRINQRGYVSAATLAAGAYGHDRFKAGASGGDYSFTQLNSSTQVTIASGKSLIQVVEDKNVVGGSYVLSWTGTALARVGVNSATPSGTFVVSPILITGQTAGTTMSVEFNAGTLNTAQLELGTVATPFERRPIGVELAVCQRYFQTYFLNTPTHAEVIMQGMSATVGQGTITLKVTMRAPPTTTKVGGVISIQGSGSVGTASLTNAAGTVNVAALIMTSNTSVTTIGGCCSLYSSAANTGFTMSAEL